MKRGNVCLLLLSLIVSTCDAESENETVRVNDGGEGVLKSTGFPYGCCHSSVHSIIYVGNKTGCIKLSFTDLDLPLSASLKVYSTESSGGVAHLIFDHRRSYNASTARTLLCPGIFSSTRNGTLRLEVNSEAGTDSIPFSRYYAGFRARFWTSQDGCLTSGGQQASSHQPEYCQVISTVSSGEEIDWKPTPPAGAVAEYQLVTDHIWVIKRPSYVSAPNALVFLRLVDFSINGTFEIRRDLHSQTALFADQSLASDSSSPLWSIGATSIDGIYVRASVDPLTTGHAPPHVHFVTGVYYQGVSAAKAADWFSCSNSSFFIPERHVCDNIVHCQHRDDESPSLCLSAELEGTTVGTVDNEPLSFLRWLLPVIASFILIAIVIFAIKMYFRSKGHVRRRRRHDEPDYIPSNDNHYDPASRDPMMRPSSDRIPVPAIRVPSQAVCIPIAGSLGGPGHGYGSASIRMGSPRQSLMMQGSPSVAGTAPPRSPPPEMSRAAPILIPTGPRPSVTVAAPAGGATAAPIVVRPVVHRDAGTVVPPSYEEATAEHSVGDSTDSLNEAPDVIPEYHPPSYEDASQGKTVLVSSWVVAGRSHPAS